MAYGDPEAPDDGSNDGSSGGDPVGSQNGSNQGSKTGGGKKGEGDPVAPGASSSSGNLSDAIGALGNLIGKGKRTSSGVLSSLTLQGLPANVAKEVFDSGVLSQNDTSKGLLGLLSGLVNKDTPVSKSITHPDEGLFGIQSSTLTSPGYTKAVDSQGNALSANEAKQKIFQDAFPAEAERIRTKLKDPKLSLAEKAKLTKNLRNITRSDQYSKAMAMNNPGLQFGAKLMGSLVSPVLGVAQSVDNALTSMGFIDDTTPQDVMDMDTQDVAGSPDLPIFNAEEQEQSVSVLMSVVRKNPEIFKTISKEELKNLLRNPIKFWEFYNKAKEG